MPLTDLLTKLRTYLGQNFLDSIGVSRALLNNKAGGQIRFGDLERKAAYRKIRQRYASYQEV